LAATLTVPEIVIGSVTLIVAVIAWMALLLLDNHVGTFGAICAASAGALIVLAVVTRFLSARPKVSLDPWTCGIVIVLVGLGVFMLFPGYSYGLTDKDPGVYMALGAGFARAHSYSIPDVLVQHFRLVVDQTPGARFPGLWEVPGSGTMTPQFYHFWPALLAVAYDIGGLRLEAQVTPFIGVLSVCTFALLLRRVVPGRASLWAAGIGGLLLVTNFMQVWQAKYPSTELMSQLLFLSILLFACISVRTGWRPAAGAAGLLLGFGWLNRADYVLLIAIAAVAVAGLVAFRRADSRVLWFGVGFAVVLPHALWQAYAGARQYSFSNAVPHLNKLLVGAAILTLLTLAIRSRRGLVRAVTQRLENRRWQFWLGFAICAVYGLLLALGFFRPRLLGASTLFRDGTVMRTWNDQNMRRLSWFLTLAAFPIGGIGLALGLLRRWRSTIFIAAGPSLLVMPVFIANSRVSPLSVEWWIRRYVPEVLPGIVLLMAVALSWAIATKLVVVLNHKKVAIFFTDKMRALKGRSILALPAFAVTGVLLAVYLSQSLPLRHHDEYGGSFQVTAEMAQVSGKSTGVYLFGQTACCGSPEYLFGGSLWLERGEIDALMPPDSQPTDYPRQAASYIRQVAAAMPAHPVFIVWEGTVHPAVGSVGVKAVKHITASLPQWVQTNTYRPNEEGPPVLVDFTIWRVTGT